MAIDLHWLGDATTTTAKVCFRSTTNGVPEIKLGGQVFTGASVSTAVDDGTGEVTITGLSANKKYTGKLSVGGDSVTVTPRTMPSGDKFNFLWGSCIDTNLPMPAMKRLVSDYDPVLFIHQGDFFYQDRTIDYTYHPGWGGNEPVEAGIYANSTDTALAYEWCRLAFSDPNMFDVFRKMPFYWMQDDHEFKNDFSMYQVIAGFPATPLHPTYTNFAESMVDFYQTYNEAQRAYRRGNPSNNDTGIDSDPIFYAKYFRKTVGDVEFFMCDPISYRSAITDPETINKRMLGATQEAWLYNHAVTSTAKYKIFSLNKAFHEPGTGGNSDTYADYTTERKRIIDTLSQITTSAIISGDKHSPQTSYANPTVGTYGYAGYLLDVMASPMASTPFWNIRNGANADEDYIPWVHGQGPKSNYYDDYCCIGLGEVDGDTIKLSQLTMAGYKKRTWTLDAGSNKVKELM